MHIIIFKQYDEEEDNIKDNFLIKTVENIILATNKDPELYLRMEMQFFEMKGKLTNDTKKQIIKDFKRLKSLKIKKEFSETLNISDFNDPLYKPTSITIHKNGIIKYQNLTKQIEAICNGVIVIFYQQILLYLDNIFNKILILDKDMNEDYHSFIEKCNIESKSIYEMISLFTIMFKNDYKED